MKKIANNLKTRLYSLFFTVGIAFFFCISASLSEEKELDLDFPSQLTIAKEKAQWLVDHIYDSYFFKYANVDQFVKLKNLPPESVLIFLQKFSQGEPTYLDRLISNFEKKEGANIWLEVLKKIYDFQKGKYVSYSPIDESDTEKKDYPTFFQLDFRERIIDKIFKAGIDIQKELIPFMDYLLKNDDLMGYSVFEELLWQLGKRFDEHKEYIDIVVSHLGHKNIEVDYIVLFAMVVYYHDDMKKYRVAVIKVKEKINNREYEKLKNTNFKEKEDWYIKEINSMANKIVDIMDGVREKWNPDKEPKFKVFK
ncbi:MAG: hypothetical protein AB1656_07630 [Candidatus Omnitrophota bacterium]